MQSEKIIWKTYKVIDYCIFVYLYKYPVTLKIFGRTTMSVKHLLRVSPEINVSAEIIGPTVKPKRKPRK